MIVVDLGYFGHGMYDSPGALIEHFQPDLLFGFDPLGAEGIGQGGGAVIVTSTLAAWTHWGPVPFKAQGTGSRVERGGTPVQGFNLAEWLLTLPPPIVLKMDVEGAELRLCRALKRTGMDRRLARLLVEEHGHPIPKLACPVEGWWM